MPSSQSYRPESVRAWVNELRSTPKGEAPSEEIFTLLLDYISDAIEDRRRGTSWEADHPKKPLTKKARRAMLRRVDELFRSGAAWPHMLREFQGDDYFPFGVRIRTEDYRKPTKPPKVPYCIRWMGAYWAPCYRPKDRKEAGYVALQATWPKPLPKADDYFQNSSGRGRTAYRICEVERYESPRGQHRFTCRLWCVRVLPEDIPKSARVHGWYWHKRAKRR